MSLDDEYRTAAEPFADLLASVPAAAWQAPSPCEGWTTADVVQHLVETQRDFLARHGAEVGPVPDVAADPAAAWRTHAAGVASLLADAAFTGQEFDGLNGPTTVEATVRDFYLFDMLVHRWDVARGAGLPATLSDTELDLVERSADVFGENAYRYGVFREGVEPPPGAGRQARVLARLGRRD